MSGAVAWQEAEEMGAQLNEWKAKHQVNCKQRYRFPYMVSAICAYRVFVQLGNFCPT